MRGALDPESRHALLREAQRVRERLEDKVAAEAATALAIVLRDGLGALEQALDASTRVELGAATQHWHDFRAGVASLLRGIAEQHGTVGAAFFLGWLKRLAKLSKPKATRSSARTAPPAARLTTSTPAVGSLVEGVLLEERTRKGGWKARHEPSGRSGPVQNSADVPATAKPGDRVTLMVASVSTKEIAFRVPDANPTVGPEQKGRRR